MRKGAAGAADAKDTGGDLAAMVVAAVARHLAEPAVGAFARAIADQGIIYQSDAFGTTLAQVFDLARLLGSESSAAAQRRTLAATSSLPASRR